MKRKVLILFLFITTVSCYGQFDAMYSQYMRNMILINPGYTGIDDYGSATLLHRQQWIGYSGSPITTGISYHTPFLKKNIGIGGSIIHDKVGPYNQADLNCYFAYHIKLNEEISLGAGLNGNVSYTSFDFSDLVGSPDYDPLFASNVNKTLPNIGSGLLLYAQNWYFGVSIPRTFEAELTEAGNVSYANKNLAKKQRSYFINGGYIFELSPYWKFKPATTLRISENLPLNGEFTANFIVKDAFSFGAMYRLQESTGINLYYQISRKIAVGYALDIPTWGGFAYSYGSHELMLKIDFIKRDLDVVCPRYY